MKNTIRISNTCSPIISLPKVTECTDIFVLTMSYGGGSGGGFTEWVDMVDERGFKENKLIKCRDVKSGRAILINTSFVVKIEKKKMVRVEEDITAWRNYSKVQCTKAIRDAIYIMDIDDKYAIVNGEASEVANWSNIIIEK